MISVGRVHWDFWERYEYFRVILFECGSFSERGPIMTPEDRSKGITRECRVKDYIETIFISSHAVSLVYGECWKSMR